MIKVALKYIVFRAAYALGLFALFDWLNRDALRIYSYHAVISDYRFRVSGMDFEEVILEKQLRALLARYRIERIDRLLQRPSRAIGICFDDGTLSDATRVVPMLDRLGIKGTFFVCADLVAGRMTWTWNDAAFLVALSGLASDAALTPKVVASAREISVRTEAAVRAQHIQNPYRHVIGNLDDEGLRKLRMLAQRLDGDRLSCMSADHLRAMIRSGHLIGSHGGSHCILSYLTANPDQLRTELTESRSEIERLIGTNVQLLAYPFGGIGDVGPTSERCARSAGYTAAFYNVTTNNRSAYSLGRFSLPHTATPCEIYAITSGFVHYMKTGRLLPRMGLTGSLGETST